MRVDRILYPVQTLGPGRRVAVWTAGCGRRCHGCANPELWEARPGQDVEVADLSRALVEAASSRGTGRITFTGGDPLEQAGELLSCLEAIRSSYHDVLVYTGFTMAELERRLGPADMGRLRACVDVLIDGPYVEALNDGCPLRGSSNQTVHYLCDEDLRREYEAYMGQGRRVQNFVWGGRVISVGIHDRWQQEAEPVVDGPSAAAGKGGAA